MDYSRRELADRLASEYVLGTLQGPARRRFESLLSGHPLLRESVAQWQSRLLPLSSGVAEVEPPERVWQRIEASLFKASPVLKFWQRLGLWRAVSGLASVAAVALLLLVVQVPPAQAPIVVVLASNPAIPAEGQAMQASFVASVSADGRALVLKPLAELALTPGRALELWAVPPEGAPRSLGLVQTSGATTLMRAQLLLNTAAFAVSVEPSGGSTTGAPTGPIVSLGKLDM